MSDLVLDKVNPNKALWEKGDFTRIAETMRQSGEELVATLGIKPSMNVLDLGCGDGTTALPAAKLGANVPGVDIAANLVAAGNERARRPALTNLCFREGDASNLENIDSEQLRSRRQHFRRDVRAAAVRRRQGNGARHQARRTDRHGQLDPRRSDARRSDPEDQRRLHAAAAGGLRHPMTWGDENQVRERFETAGIARKTSASSASPGSSASRVSRASCWRSSAIITVRP